MSIPCSLCNGYGISIKSKLIECYYCNGTGGKCECCADEICLACFGSGSLIKMKSYSCYKCNGKGYYYR